MPVGLSNGGSYADEDEYASSIASGMPLGSPTEPADALKQSGSYSPTLESQKVNTNPANGPVKVNQWVTIGPEDIDKAIDIAGSFGTGTMMGVKSKTLNKTALYEAQNLIADGAHPEDVWSKTGTFQGADGRWRQEIPDNTSVLKDENLGKQLSNRMAQAPDVFVNRPDTNFFGQIKKGTILGDILDHPDLYEAYPALKDLPIHPMPPGVEARGMATDAGVFMASMHPDSFKSVLLHEVQHIIQNYEGFARGGSSSEFKNHPAAGEMYRRIMGEVEARNVQARSDMNRIELQRESPMSTEDRPRQVQIRAPGD